MLLHRFAPMYLEESPAAFNMKGIVRFSITEGKKMQFIESLARGAKKKSSFGFQGLAWLWLF